MQINTLHSWDMSPQAAMQLQEQMAGQLRDEPIVLDQLRYVAGVDVSVKDNVSQAAVVICTFPALELVETALAQEPTTFPYIAGLLTFREGAVLVQAFQKLTIEPDVFVFDGMGRIHPRRMGIAAHLGLWLDKPTIGCGKTHFLGDYSPPAEEQGAYSLLNYKGATLGAVVRTKTKTKPVYISAGHRATLESAIALALACTTQYRLPQPIRFAHQAAGK
jgi:deoxyribonuclease V